MIAHGLKRTTDIEIYDGAFRLSYISPSEVILALSQRSKDAQNLYHRNRPHGQKPRDGMVPLIIELDRRYANEERRASWKLMV